uniref:DUF4806 domain-containing protein n=1 Tax=Culex tarsalis TaxID=7177 RepID=A0A1Q3F276_CULTA
MTPTRPQPSSSGKKVPIIRKAGEVVTPMHLRTIANVEVSPMLKPKSKPNWSKITPPTLKALPRKPVPTTSIVKQRVSPPHFDEDSRSNLDDEDPVQAEEETAEVQEQTESPDDQATTSKTYQPSEARMKRIESKLDLILEKLNQHDGALKVLKYNIRDLRVDLKNSTRQQAEVSTFEVQKHKATPVKREKKRLVLFPVPDDNYLYRLEELIQTDDDIRDEVITLFSDGPATSLYDYLRRNMSHLFENCSKHTWTGKPPHNGNPDAPPPLPACNLSLVEVLIATACDKFPNLTRDSIEKELRRALQNFNEAHTTRLNRRKEKERQLGVVPGELSDVL